MSLLLLVNVAGAQQPQAPANCVGEGPTYYFQTVIRGKAEVIELPTTWIDGLLYAGGDWVVGTCNDANDFGDGSHGAAYPVAGRTWPKGEVPYAISPLLQKALGADVADIDQAAEDWNTGTSGAVHFLRCTPSDDGASCMDAGGWSWDHYVLVDLVKCEADARALHLPASNACRVVAVTDDPPGRVRGAGAQVVRIGTLVPEYSVTHEFGHVLGLFHEHCRDDRDKYIMFDETAVCPSDAKAQFTKIDGGIKGDDYDFGSIMQYDSKAFACGGKSTLVKKENGGLIPPNQSVSSRDVALVKTLYSKRLVGTAVSTSAPWVATAPSIALDDGRLFAQDSALNVLRFEYSHGEIGGAPASLGALSGTLLVADKGLAYAADSSGLITSIGKRQDTPTFTIPDLGSILYVDSKRTCWTSTNSMALQCGETSDSGPLHQWLVEVEFPADYLTFDRGWFYWRDADTDVVYRGRTEQGAGFTEVTLVARVEGDIVGISDGDLVWRDEGALRRAALSER